MLCVAYRLEHVQEFTRQLDESDEEEEEEDDMPALQLKHGRESPLSASDKPSVNRKLSGIKTPPENDQPSENDKLFKSPPVCDEPSEND